MFKTYSSAALIATLVAFSPSVLASKITPCTMGAGNGDNNGCSYCSDDKAIDITPWDQATKDSGFDLPKAASKVGGGWDVWWKIDQPDPGCHVLLTAPYITEQGSYDPRLSGNVILSTAHGGCYYAHVDSRGVSASFCCGSGHCTAAGAIPKSSSKRDVTLSSPNPPSRIVKEARNWSGAKPSESPSAAPQAAVTCSKGTPVGDTYTKAGPQQIDGQTLSCNGGQSCDISPVMSVSASSSVSSEHSVSFSDTSGVSLSVTAGFMFIGPTATVTGTVSEDWTKGVTDSVGQSSTNTVTKSLTLSIGLMPGVNFNLWFTPTLRCQKFSLTCNGADMSVERCRPELDGNGNPTGDHGVMTVG